MHRATVACRPTTTSATEDSRSGNEPPVAMRWVTRLRRVLRLFESQQWDWRGSLAVKHPYAIAL
jgi:hypothetical protein